MIDGTVYAQMAISGIIRTRESLNLQLLMDLLKGSGKAEVLNVGLNKVKTYGVGRELSYLDWRTYISQMVDQGLIRIDLTDNSKLKTTPLSNQVLQKSIAVKLAKYEKPETTKKKIVTKEIFSDYDMGLFEKLREWRSQKARAAGIPPYIVFNDKTLKQLAAHMPTDKNSLLNIDGIGKVKLESYGEEIVEIINEYI